jgi:hypothetical protein
MAYAIANSFNDLDKPHKILVTKDMTWHLVETSIALKCD